MIGRNSENNGDKQTIMLKLLYFLISLFPLAVSAQCSFVNNVFGDGETISYTASYNWGPVWLDAGIVTFSVKNETYLGKPAIHLNATGKTFPSYDILFKVRDYYDAWIDPDTYQSIDFRRYIYEGGYTLLNTLHFDHSNQRILSNTKTNNNPQRTDTLKTGPCIFDMLSAIYYTRTLDIGSMNPDTKKTVTVVIDDNFYGITIRSLGREIVENTDGRKYRCLKFAAKMVEGTIFRGDEDVMVWITDDGNKIPVYIEAKIIIGTVKAYLKEAKGLKNPVTSLVK